MKYLIITLFILAGCGGGTSGSPAPGPSGGGGGGSGGGGGGPVYYDTDLDGTWSVTLGSDTFTLVMDSGELKYCSDPSILGGNPAIDAEGDVSMRTWRTTGTDRAARINWIGTMSGTTITGTAYYDNNLTNWTEVFTISQISAQTNVSAGLPNAGRGFDTYWNVDGSPDRVGAVTLDMNGYFVSSAAGYAEFPNGPGDTDYPRNIVLDIVDMKLSHRSGLFFDCHIVLLDNKELIFSNAEYIETIYNTTQHEVYMTPSGQADGFALETRTTISSN